MHRSTLHGYVDPPGYTTRNVCVPIPVLMEALTVAMVVRR